MTVNRDHANPRSLRGRARQRVADRAASLPPGLAGYRAAARRGVAARRGAATTIGATDAGVAAFGAGTHIGQYRIEGLLGAGGMGVVYRATCTKLNRPAAIKFLSLRGRRCRARGGDSRARRRPPRH